MSEIEHDYIYSFGVDFGYWGIPFAVVHEYDEDNEILSIHFLCFCFSVENIEVSQ